MAFDTCRERGIVSRKLDSFLSRRSIYKPYRVNRHVELRGVRVAVKSRHAVFFLLQEEKHDVAKGEAPLEMLDCDKHCHDNTLDNKNDDTTNRRSAIARLGMIGTMIGTMMWVGEQNNKAQAWAGERVKYVARKEGFQFEYPSESFVVAFDRTGGGTKDGALVSVGDFTKYIVISVFQQGRQSIPASVASTGLDTESGYALCLDPVIQADSTVGFRVIEALMIPPMGESPDGGGTQGVFAFEYQVSICRGDTILEGKGGALRCQGAFGQDVPIQDKHVAGRAFLNTNGSLITIMASVPKDTWQSSEQVVRDIIGSFRPTFRILG